MVHYPVPKYITKAALRNAADFAFSADAAREDHVAVVATCTRCAQNLVKLPNDCNKTREKRCDHCKDGNRGGCTLVPKELNGRVNRLYDLRRRYRAAVDNAAAGPVARRADPQVQATGLKLARAQKRFNLELANLKRVAAHLGTPIGVPTQVPTTTPQYLGLVLVEQRRIANALEALVPLMTRIAANTTPPVPPEEDSDDDSDGPDDGPAPDDGNVPGDEGGQPVVDEPAEPEVDDDDE